MKVTAHVQLRGGGTFRVKYDNNRRGRRITSMHVTSSRNFVAFNRASWLSFVETFRDTPSLTSLLISGDVHPNLGRVEDNKFNVETLIQIIEAIASEDPTKIKELKILCKTLTGAAGADDGWERLRQCAELHLQGLEEVNIDMGHRSRNDGEDPQRLEPLIRTLFVLPTLKWVNLGVIGMNLSPTTLSNLSHCQSLCSFDMAKVELKDDQIIALSGALLNTRTLSNLHVQISDELENPWSCGRALSSMLQLCAEPSMKVYGSSSRPQDDFHLGFIDGMPPVSASGNSIEVALAFYVKMSERDLNAYMEMAKENYSLIRFGCQIESQELYRKLQFEVALNRVVRSKVMELASTNGNQKSISRDSGRGQWVDLLVQANEYDDGYIDFEEDEDVISIIFYVLSHNPMLCLV